jgi:hypothetical protein
MKTQLELAMSQLRQLGRFGGDRLEPNVFDSEQHYLNALEEVVGYHLAEPKMADEIRDALARYNQWRQWATNHYDPEDGDPYTDRVNSYREDVELLAESFADEH